MLNAKRVALSLGGTAAIAHIAWSLIVALGWGQALYDFAHHAHFITPMATVEPFNAGTALMVIVLAFLIGSGIGFLFANVWNRLGA